MTSVYLNLKYDPLQDRYWMHFSYNPDFLARWKSLTSYPSREYDPETKGWWFPESYLWRELEWLCHEFDVRVSWK